MKSTYPCITGTYLRKKDGVVSHRHKYIVLTPLAEVDLYDHHVLRVIRLEIHVVGGYCRRM